MQLPCRKRLEQESDAPSAPGSAPDIVMVAPSDEYDRVFETLRCQLARQFNAGSKPEIYVKDEADRSAPQSGATKCLGRVKRFNFIFQCFQKCFQRLPQVGIVVDNCYKFFFGKIHDVPSSLYGSLFALQDPAIPPQCYLARGLVPAMADNPPFSGASCNNLPEFCVCATRCADGELKLKKPRRERDREGLSGAGSDSGRPSRRGKMDGRLLFEGRFNHDRLLGIRPAKTPRAFVKRKHWRSLRESNPCFSLERAAS